MTFAIERIVSLALGWAVAWCIGWLVGLVWPSAREWVFMNLGILWTAVGVVSIYRRFRDPEAYRRLSDRVAGSDDPRA